ncbi:MAG: ABC-F type ribosomal protection protein [Lachnospiraceae bacterium]|nr:ABC-F type ribosomal protection protein [Lachnospiraceae bacterium]
MILNIKNISKSYGIKDILTNVSMIVNEHDRVGIVGINGAGKSTLFKIIMGEETADSGEIIVAHDVTIGYLAQNSKLDTNETIYNELLNTRKEILELEAKLLETEEELKNATEENSEEVLNRYHEIHDKFERMNGYSYKSSVTGILRGLGFAPEEFDKKTDVLSGGQKTRVALGKMLLSNPDIILLDEPTNHLDLNSITWLEGYLSNYRGTVIVIAHDRYFLNKIVTRILEIDHTKGSVYEGNYEAYAEKKARQRESLMRHYLNQQREIKHQEEVITKLRSFNREKSIKRAESREKMLEHMEVLERPDDDNKEMSLRLEPNIVSGNDVLMVENLKKSFGEQLLFDKLNFKINRGDRAAIIGNNGTGKTTILKIINEVLAPDGGSFRLGAKVHLAYYDQEHHVLDDELTIFDEISNAYPFMTNTRIRTVLAAFLFTDDDVFKKIGDLSGGEKGRVSLAKLMLSDANFIILDEPTNHLDIVSKEVLENALKSYTGTLLFVSHDRYFINKVATRIFDLTQQTFVPYEGNYDYYLDKKELIEDIYLGDKASLAVKQNTISESKLDRNRTKELQAKVRRLKNDISKAEEKIEALENENAELNEQLLLPDNATDHELLLEISLKIKQNEEEASKLMEEWERLQEELEESSK